MKSDFLIAITQLAAERNLPREVVLSAIEAALVSAFRKDSAPNPPEVTVTILPNSGEIKVFASKTVVETAKDPDREISLSSALKIKKDIKIGDTVKVEVTSALSGRIAAQTAKQVVIQRLREAEREVVYAEFSTKEGDILSGVIQRIEPKQIIVDLGKSEGVLPISEQVPIERYRPGQRLKFYMLEVSRSAKGPQIILSRTHRDLVKRLFELEVPEVYNGTVEIKAIAREPGFRSKVAVVARQEGVDAVGSCVGLRGIRIQNIVNELLGEKIDVIQWHREPAALVANSLSPAQVTRVEINEAEGRASVVVPDRLLSLAIGKEGQNARLAAKLTGWKIDIKSASEATVAPPKPQAAAPAAVQEKEPAAVAPVAPITPVKEEVKTETASAEAVAAVPPTAPAPPAPKESIQPEKPPAEEESKKEQGISLEEAFKTLAKVTAPSKVRFAEDIMGNRGARPVKTKTKKGKGQGKGREEEEEGARARKAGGRGPVVSLDEELEEE